MVKKRWKASDLVAKRLSQETDYVFGITGGCIVNMFDSIEKQPNINLITMHHEQACAMAADAYARVSKKLGVCMGTSGPGITNLITGLACSYYDSIPVLAIGGQVPKKHLRSNLKCPPRQLGFQEVDACEITIPVTKMSFSLNEQRDLDMAIRMTKVNRKGPVFLEFCDDTQREIWKEDKAHSVNMTSKPEFNFNLSREIKNAKRPLLILGAGLKQAGLTQKEVTKFVDILGIPTLLTWGAMDLLTDKNMFNIRDFGVTSQRIGNFAVKNADLIICVGTRLDTHQPLETKAKVIVVDNNKPELDKLPKKYIKIKEDLRNCCANVSSYKHLSWLRNLILMRCKYPIYPKSHPKGFIDPYLFIKELSDKTKENSTIITDAGQTLTWTMQAWKVKHNQNLFSAFNNSPMGYSVPASVGAFFGDPTKNLICLTGDGGLQMNLQELQTIIANKIPVKIFVMDNKGYGMIKQTQSDWKGLKDNVACDPYISDYLAIAKAIGFKTYKLKTKEDLKKLDNILKQNYPTIIRVNIKPGTKIQPKLKLGDKLWDQTPKLTKKEVKQIDRFLKKGK